MSTGIDEAAIRADEREKCAREVEAMADARDGLIAKRVALGNVVLRAAATRLRRSERTTNHNEGEKP